MSLISFCGLNNAAFEPDSTALNAEPLMKCRLPSSTGARLSYNLAAACRTASRAVVVVRGVPGVPTKLYTLLIRSKPILSTWLAIATIAGLMKRFEKSSIEKVISYDVKA